MNRKYKNAGKEYKTRQTGSIAKWTGLSDEGVRLYERHHLIYPEKDAQNKYREFDVMDITMLLYGMVYRESGFSMKEAERLANESSLEQVHEAYRQRTMQRRAELELEMLRLKRLEEMTAEIDQLRVQYGVCSVEMSPAMYRLEFMDRRCVFDDTRQQSHASKWMKNYLPFAMLSTRYLADTLYDARVKVEAISGLGIYAKYGHALGIEPEDCVVYCPPMRSVHVILSADNDMLCPDYSPVLRYIEENRLKVCGDPISFGIANLHFSNTFERYFHLWVPVEEQEPEKNECGID